jgi:glycosyltransferase involved in cell wall biosynthesis
VLFLGSRADVPGLLSQLDAFFYASDHDTFGISVIEAMATGIPVFVNDWEVMKEITENGERAILYRTKEEEDLFSKFSSCFESPEIYKKKARENAIWAIRTYGIKSHIEQLFGVYDVPK